MQQLRCVSFLSSFFDASLTSTLLEPHKLACCADGHGQVALSILLTDSYPSFGHMLVENMTTLCENWKCGFHDPGGGSQNVRC